MSNNSTIITEKILRVLRYSSNVWYLAEGMLGPLFAIFTQSVGGSIFDIAWAWGIFLVVNGILIVVVGKISDKVMRGNTLMIIGYALNAICTFGYLFVSSTTELFFVQIGLGIASALATPTWDALYARLEEARGERYEIWALAEGEKELLTGLGLFLGGLIVSHFSFRMLFIVMGVIQVTATVLVWYCIKGDTMRKEWNLRIERGKK